MKVQAEVSCPECGAKFLADVLVNTFGRKPKNIPIKIVSKCLTTHPSVASAAKALGVSPSWLYNRFGREKVREMRGVI